MTLQCRSRLAFDMSKRLFDAVVAALAFVLLLPVMAITAALVYLNLGKPILFKQERPGRGGQVFTLVKFRTMRPVDPGKGMISSASRMTSFGAGLRSTSLDELPTLINVIRGEMSLVGPRPLLVEYLPLYTSEQTRRHDVRPGITGLAQVNGRNNLDFERRFEYDVFYVQNRSWKLDISILARTVLKVLRREDITTQGYAAGASFMGQAPSG